jgi:hypothetical protein
MVKLNWDRILEVVKIGVLIVIAYSLFGIASGMNNPPLREDVARIPETFVDTAYLYMSHGVYGALPEAQLASYEIVSALSGIESALRGIERAIYLIP